MQRNRGNLLFVTFLTMVRFPLVLLFFFGALTNALLAPRSSIPWLFMASFVSLILSAITDLFDGYFARRLNVETRFGAHADPLMDKFFFLATLPLLVFVATTNGNLRHATTLLVLTLLFLTRDQWVTFLRSIGSMYNISGRANWSGKLRTGINFPLVCAIYFFEEAPWSLIPAWALYVFEAVAFLVNFLTLYIYTRTYWPALRRSVQLDGPQGDAP